MIAAMVMVVVVVVMVMMTVIKICFKLLIFTGHTRNGL
jgi:hypothetical protein